jgi:hypothetical protein
MQKFEVVIYEKKGRGLECTRKIKKDEVIVVNHALIISAVQNNDTTIRRHVMEYSPLKNIIMLGECTLVNHSDDANAEILIEKNEISPRVILVALQEIKKGEEITINYGPNYPKTWRS